MNQESQSERTTSNFIEVEGTGTVATKKGYRDVVVYGYFTKWHWSFIVHQDVLNPEFVTVSEASTGFQLKNESYYTIEDALYFALPYIEAMHYRFATRVGNVLAKTQCNLLKRNTTGLQTAAIDMIWMKS